MSPATRLRRQPAGAELALKAERQPSDQYQLRPQPRRAVGSYLSKVTEEELLSVPGLQPLRQLLAERSKFYSSSLRSRATVQLRVGLGYRLGIIHRDLGMRVRAAANNGAIRTRKRYATANSAAWNCSPSWPRYYMAKRYDDTIQLSRKSWQPSDAVAVQSTLAETYNTLAITKSDGVTLPRP
jgi:hypothetical protein